MKNIVLAALVYALLGVTTDLNVTQVNGVATKNTSQMKAKSASTLKALLSIDSMADVAARALMKAEARA